MQQINAKNVHPVYGDGIRTHKLLIESPPLTTRPFSMLLIYLFVPEKLYSNKFSFWMKCQKFFSTFLSTCTYWQTLYQLFGAWKNFQERERERERERKKELNFRTFLRVQKLRWFDSEMLYRIRRRHPLFCRFHLQCDQIGWFFTYSWEQSSLQK